MANAVIPVRPTSSAWTCHARSSWLCGPAEGHPSVWGPWAREPNTLRTQRLRFAPASPPCIQLAVYPQSLPAGAHPVHLKSVAVLVRVVHMLGYHGRIVEGQAAVGATGARRLGAPTQAHVEGGGAAGAALCARKAAIVYTCASPSGPPVCLAARCAAHLAPQPPGQAPHASRGPPQRCSPEAAWASTRPSALRDRDPPGCQVSPGAAWAPAPRPGAAAAAGRTGSPDKACSAGETRAPASNAPRARAASRSMGAALWSPVCALVAAA